MSAAANPKSILILRTSMMGDIINALPSLVALRKTFPEARIGWVVDDRFEEVLSGHPYLDDVFVLSRHRWRKMAKTPRGLLQALGEMRALIRRLRAGRYEVSVDLQTALKTALVTRVARCRTRIAIRDFNRRAHWLYGNVVVTVGDQATANQFLTATAATGADISLAGRLFWVPEEDRDWAKAAISAHGFTETGPLVGFNPGSSSPWRRWPPEMLGKVAATLRDELGARIVILGGPGEVELARAIADHAGGTPLFLAGKCTIKQLAAVLEACDLLVTGDSGPMHVAAAVGTRTVALFSTTRPERSGPWGAGHTLLQAQGLPCIPCYNRPTCSDFGCLRLISADQVVSAARAALAAPKAPKPCH
jgi:ADP-heptose:LPS heptosyltransferase